MLWPNSVRTGVSWKGSPFDAANEGVWDHGGLKAQGDADIQE